MPIYSLSAAAGAAVVAGGGASGTGAAGARAAFGAGGFFAATGAAACAEAAAGPRGAAAAFAAGEACRVVAVGSGLMMLTGGVDDALGNSALVGLPVGIEGGNPASAAVAGSPAGAAAIAVAGAFQVGAWRATS